MAGLIPPSSSAYGIQAYALSSATRSGQGSLFPTDKQPEPPVTSEKTTDQVFISARGKELSATPASTTSTKEGENQQATGDKKGSGQERQLQPLDESELRQIKQLKSRDTEVRAHEQAHLAAAGSYAAGGPSFSYQTGPDGKRYAVGGSVPIDMGEESTPAATITKMRTVKRAALAPASPSAADRQIAAQAGMKENQARQELQGQQNAPSSSPLTSSPQNNTITPDSPLPEQPAPQDHAGSQPPADNQTAGTRKLMLAAYQAMATLS